MALCYCGVCPVALTSMLGQELCGQWKIGFSCWEMTSNKQCGRSWAVRLDLAYTSGTVASCHFEIWSKAVRTCISAQLR